MRTTTFNCILASAILVAGAAIAQPGFRHGHGGDGDRLWTGLATDFDADGNGEITLDELGGAQSTFDNLDRDGDGVVTQSDFGRRGPRDFARGRRMERGVVGGMAVRIADTDRDGTVTGAELDAFLTELDANGDGVVEDNEIRALFSRGGPGGDHFDRDEDGVVEVEDFRAIFAALDDDGDGDLTGDELPHVRGPHGHGPHGPFGGFIVRGADADGDGAITTAEWQDQVSRLDGDGNATIDEDEWLASLPSDREPPPDFFEIITQHLDRNDNGVLETSDLDTIFTEHDADGNGVIEEDELPRRHLRGRRGGGRF